MGSVRGTVVDPGGQPLPRAAARLARVDGMGEPLDVKTSRTGEFEFLDVAPGWYILSIFMSGFRDAVQAVYIEDAPVDAGALMLPIGLITEGPIVGRPPRPPPVRVLTVCEALESRDAIAYQSVVIVGIFKSGMDDTLRLDCPFQLVTGEVGWPSSIGLTAPTNPPDSLRKEVEKKRAEVLKTGPPGAQPRSERVVALYGIFVAPTGLTSAPCCRASVETTFPPARLFGVAEKDLRVIR